jgi:hypothetical protein
VNNTLLGVQELRRVMGDGGTTTSHLSLVLLKEKKVGESGRKD